jgi:hypothetical protein
MKKDEIGGGGVHVSHMWEKRNAYRVLVMKREGKNRLEDLGIEGSMILKKCK